MKTNPLGLILIALGAAAGLLWVFYGSQTPESPASLIAFWTSHG